GVRIIVIAFFVIDFRTIIGVHGFIPSESYF
ncbi:MAG: hypothetical protein ACI8XG_000732, partial [Congregibacter sp.]